MSNALATISSALDRLPGIRHTARDEEHLVLTLADGIVVTITRSPLAKYSGGTRLMSGCRH